MQSVASRAVASDGHGILLAVQQYVFFVGIVGWVSFDDITYTYSYFYLGCVYVYCTRYCTRMMFCTDIPKGLIAI